MLGEPDRDLERDFEPLLDRGDLERAGEPDFDLERLLEREPDLDLDREALLAGDLDPDLEDALEPERDRLLERDPDFDLERLFDRLFDRELALEPLPERDLKNGGFYRPGQPNKDYLSIAQCGNFKIFLSFRFYVKSNF